MTVFKPVEEGHVVPQMPEGMIGTVEIYLGLQRINHWYVENINVF